MPGGRQKGTIKTGGRQKGTRNLSTMDQMLLLVEVQRSLYRQLEKEIDVTEILPLDVLLLLMRAAAKAGHLQLTLAAASAAAPYCHPKLQSTELNATLRRAPTDFTDQDLRALIGKLDSKYDMPLTMN